MASTGSSAAHDPAGLTLAEASAAVRANAISPTELTQACLERIHKLNPAVNAFITVTEAEALAQAPISMASSLKVNGAVRCTAFPWP